MLVMNTKKKIAPLKNAIANIEEMMKRINNKMEQIRQVSCISLQAFL